MKEKNVLEKQNKHFRETIFGKFRELLYRISWEDQLRHKRLQLLRVTQFAYVCVIQCGGEIEMTDTDHNGCIRSSNRNHTKWGKRSVGKGKE